MTIKKFGLAELERYEGEVGFKKSDVRIIKGVCAIVDLPVTVAPEAQEVIAACGKDVIASEKRIVKIDAEDAQNDEATKQGIVTLEMDREATKSLYKQAKAASKVEVRNYNGEVARLQKLLKNFS